MTKGKFISHLNKIIARILRYTPFSPVHMGVYIRSLHFWKCLKQLPVEDFTDVLDAGCGRGKYAIEFSKKFPQVRVTAIDLNPINFREGRIPTNIVFKQGDLRNLDDMCAYDFIYCIDVLEHIPNNITVIQNFHKALKKGGFLYIHMPGKVKDKRILPDRFFTEFDARMKKEHIGEQYTLEEMCSLLKKIGFNIVEKRYTFGFCGKIAWELPWAFTGNLIKIFIKILLMPLLKFLGRMDVWIKSKTGRGILIIAQKAKSDKKIRRE